MKKMRLFLRALTILGRSSLSVFLAIMMSVSPVLPALGTLTPADLTEWFTEKNASLSSLIQGDKEKVGFSPLKKGEIEGVVSRLFPSFSTFTDCSESTGNPFTKQACKTVQDYLRRSNQLAQIENSSSINTGWGLGLSKPLLGAPVANADAWSCGQYITDSRDSKTYPTVQIGSQCWMAKNLNVGTKVNGGVSQGSTCPSAAEIEKWCYANNEANCTTYGALYTWSQTMCGASQCNGTGASPNDACSTPVQGICPTGWHLPSHYELTTLERAVCTSGSCTTDFPYNTTTMGWQGTDEGTKLKPGGSSGFEALLAGNFVPMMSSFMGLTAEVHFWTTTQTSGSSWRHNLTSGQATVGRATYATNYGFSARCLKDPDITPPVPSGFSPASASTITDSTQDITFTTDENATCKVSLTDQAYADMSVTCTGGGTTSHTCTTPDLGADGEKNVYIACTDGTNEDTADTNENLTYTLTSPTYATWDGDSGTDKNCSTAGNWVGGVAPQAADDVVIDATADTIIWDSACAQTVNSLTLDTGFTGTLQINTTYTGGAFDVFTITNNLTVNAGTVTHKDNSTAETYRLNLAVGGDFAIGAGGNVNADSKGYDAWQGLGKPTSGNYDGGSHGGRGGDYASDNTVGPTYGSLTSPTSLGSGGAAGAGGGAIVVITIGTVTVNGTISANGEDNAGSGAGGSINITAGVLAGSGTIRANGGSSSNTGSGGGGRIGLNGVTTDIFSGTLQVNEGSTYTRGYAGTIYFNSEKRTNLTIGGAGNISSLKLGTDDDATAYTFGTLTIQDGGILEIDSNLYLNSGNGGAASLSVTSLDVQTGGILKTDGLGFPAALGPGTPSGPYDGGSYGGRGGDYAYNSTTGSTYGSVVSPVSLGSGGSGGPGGGAVVISATGTITINGILSADAGNGSLGRGSGGSINITAATLAGSGTIRANGGSSSNVGSGGGGRISLNGVTSDTFSGVLQANGGTTVYIGYAGTIYLNEARRTNLVLGGEGNLSSLRLGTDDTPYNYSFGTITIQDEGVLEIDSNLYLNNGNGGAASLSVTSLDVQVGGFLKADNLGFPPTQGPGRSSTYDGGSHGGKGGDYYSDNTSGATYGSLTSPISLGSGGAGGTGGGTIILSATSTVTINGIISANGLDSNIGAGSGGSINITTDTLAGSGTIRANGGASSVTGSGGGGRISLVQTTGTAWTTTISSFGGSTNTTGAAGTVYLQDASDGANGGELIINNNNVATAAGTNTAISSTVTNATVGSLTLTPSKAGKLTIDSGQTLTVSGTLTVGTGTTLTNSGTLNLGGTTFTNSGTIDFDNAGNTVNYTGQTDDSAVTVLNTTYDSISFDNAGTTFSLGATLTVNNDFTLTSGTFDLSGEDLTVTGDVSNDSTIYMDGGETVSWTNDTDSGQVMIRGTSSANVPITEGYNVTLNDGLVGYWKFDETSAGTFADSSGYGNTGTGAGATGTNNTPQPSSTVPSLNFTNPKSLSFDGTDDYVVSQSSIGLSSDPNVTMSAWVKLLDTSGGYVISTGGGIPVHDLLFSVTSTSITVAPDHVRPITASTTITPGQWVHIAFTKTTGLFTSLKIYVNGAEQTITSGNINNNIILVSSSLYIGSIRGAATFFDGSLDDVRIYNRALTASEISALAAGNQPATSAATFTLANNLDVNGDLTLNSGNLDVSAAGCSSASCAVTVAGSWQNNGGVFTKRAGTVTLDSGASAGMTVLSGGQKFNNLTISGTDTYTLADRLNVNGTLSQTAGTLDVSTNNYNIVTGTLSQTAGTLTARSGTVTLGSSSAAGMTATSSLYNLNIEDPTENGLVGYWKFDEGNGSTAYDSSGSGNNGTLTNGPKWTETVPSSPGPTFDNPHALSFDGTDDYVTANNLSTASEYSWSAWANRGTGNNGYDVVMGMGANTELRMNNLGTQPQFYGFGNKTLTSPDLIAIGEWHHWVMTVTADGVIKLYIDSVEKASDTGTFSAQGSTATIGQRANTPGQTWAGSIDDVRIYNRALSEAEIANLYAGKYADGDSGTATFTLGGGLTATGDLLLATGNLDVSASNYAITVGGDFTNSSGATAFNPRSGTLTFNGTADQIFTTGGESFYNLTVNNTGSDGDDDITVSGNLDVDNTLTVTNGDLNLSTNNPNVNTAGDVAIAGDGSVTKGTGTWTFDGTTAATFTTNNQDIGACTIDGTAKKLTLAGELTSSTLTIGVDDTLDTNANNLTATTLENNGTLILDGGETVDISGGMDTDTGTVMYSGTTDRTGLVAGNSYNNLTLNDGLVGYWKFDETSAGTFADSSGYGNTGTGNGAGGTNNTPQPTETKPTLNFTNTRALDFDGTDDYVDLGNDLFDSDNTGAVSAWIKRSGTSGNLTIISSASDSNSQYLNQIKLVDFGSGYRLRTGTRTPHNWVYGSTSINNDWHHVVVSTTGSTWSLYVDGQADTLTEDIGSNTGGWWDESDNGINSYAIGATLRAISGTIEYFDGQIDDVRIYNRALSASEVSALAAGNQPATSTTAYTLANNLDIAGNLTLSSGTLDVSASNYAINVAGSWENNGGVFTKRAGTVTLDGTASGKTLQSGGQQFNNLTVSGSGGAWTLADRLQASGTLAQTDGTLDVSANNYNIKAGTLNQSGGTFTARNGTVTLDSGSAAGMTAASSLYNLNIEDPTENGLVGYWKFDEGQGTAAADSSGSGNTGTLTNGPRWTETVPSSPGPTFTNPYALSFDGADDYVAISPIPVSGTSGLSFSFWARRLSAVSGAVLSSSEGLSVSRVSDDRIRFQAGSNVTRIEGRGSNDANWHHYVVTVMGIDGRWYEDGQDSTYSLPSAAVGVHNINAIAYAISSDSLFFPGNLDDVRIYNRVLSEAEVANLYAGKYADGDNSTATVTLGGALDTDNNLSLYSGTLDVSASNFAVTTGGNFSNYSGASGFVARAGTVTLNAVDTGHTVTTGGSSFYGLTANGVGGGWDMQDSLTVTNAFNITNGIFDLNGQALTVTGASHANTGTLRLKGSETVTGLTTDTDSGTVEYDGSTTYSGLLLGDEYNSLTINGNGGEYDLDADLDVNSNLALTLGALDLNGFDLSVGGNLTKTGGTLSNTSGRTLTLDGDNQTLNAGDVTWDTVNINGSSGTVTLGSNFSVSNLLSIIAGKVLSLVSYTVNLAQSLLNLGEINEGTGAVAGSSSSFYIADDSYDENPILTPDSESAVYISLTDQDGNLNGQTPDTLTGTTVSCATDSENITLTETGNATEVFRGSVNIAMYDGSATNNDGTLECNDGVTVTATYTDPQDGTDTQTDTATFSGENLPSAPSSLSGSAGKTSITWSWTDNSSNEDGFKLYDAANNTLIATPSSSPSGEGESPTVTYTETGLTKGTQYSRYLKSYNDAGYSSATSTVSVTTKAEPTAPSSFTGTAVSSTSITWSWTDNSDDEDGFRLYASDGTLVATTPSSSPPSEGGETTTYTETGLTKGTAYQRYLTAYNEDGNSAVTSTVSVTTSSSAPGSFSLIAPANNALTNSGLPTFSFEQSLDEDDGIAGYTLTLDSTHSFTIPVSTSATHPVSKTHYGTGFTAQYFNEDDGHPTNDRIQVTLNAAGGLNFLPLSSGAHTWYVTARDAGGNTRSTDERSFTVDAVKPALTGFADITTRETNPTLSLTATDTNALSQLILTLEKPTAFGTYQRQETRTYPLSGSSQSVTYTPKDALEAGGTYRLSATLTDSAGNIADGRITITVQTARQAAQEDLANMNADTTPVADIIEKLRATLPENPFNLPHLTTQATLRRGRQIQELSGFWQNLINVFRPVYLAIHDRLLNGQGVIERSLLGVSTNVEQATRLLVDQSQKVITQTSQNTKTVLATANDHTRTTATYLAGGARAAAQTIAGAIEQTAGIDVAGRLTAAVNILPLPDRDDWNSAKETVAEAKAQTAQILAAGSENRTRTGLKNQQALARALNAMLEPVGRIKNKAMLLARINYETIFDNDPTAISNIRITYVSEASAVIEWNTNHLSRRTKVNYGTTKGGEWTGEAFAEDKSYMNHHKVQLLNLKPDTTYYFEIMNQNGDYVYDAYYSLRTLPEGKDPVTEPLAPVDGIILKPTTSDATTNATSEDGMTQTPPSPPYQGENDDAPAYEQPNPESEIVRQLKVGQRYRALQEKGGWISLLVDSKELWVLQGRVELVPQQQPSATASHKTWEE